MSLAAERDLLSTDIPDDDAELAVHIPRIKDLLTTLANAASAMKIYPSDHETVRSFVDALTARFDAVLASLSRLELSVSEYAFLWADRIVYSDESPAKSLPFFFFKDGTETLYFERGLDRPELVAFLELVRTVAQRPGDDNDIVAALWESDFPHIQYYAPDEFLENRILAERRELLARENLPDIPSDLAHETFEVKVDRARLAEGRVVLSPVDRARLDRGWPGPDPGAPDQTPGAPAAEPEESAAIEPVARAAEAALSGRELQEIEDMVRDNRLLWPEEDFVNLTAEIIYLEEDPAICTASLDLLGEFLVEQVRAGQFPVANTLITELRELRSHLGPEASAKEALLDAALRQMTGPRTLGALDAALGPEPPDSWPSLLALFKLLGPQALPTAAGLYERWDKPELRAPILGFIKSAAASDPDLLLRLASDVRPALSAAVIGLLAELPGETGVPAIASFMAFKDRKIRLEAIQTLGRSHTAASSRVLLGFLDDPDEGLRIQAAGLLDPVGAKPSILRVIAEASAPPFRKRSFKEKQAFLSFLGRTGAPEALAFLAAALGRSTLWPSTRNREMRLAAVAGLAAMGTAAAEAVLERGAGGRGRKVREACREALAGKAKPSGGLG